MFKVLARTVYWAILNGWYSMGRFRGARLEPSIQWKGFGSRRVGKHCYIGTDSVINGRVDADIQIGVRTWIGANCELFGGRLLVGPYCSFQHRTQLHGNVRIGAGFVGGAGLYVASESHEFRWRPFLPIRRQDQAVSMGIKGSRSAPVEIGEDCWFGLNVVVMPGVMIGRGCVIGANSVVTRSLPPYSVAVGSPAQIIYQRLIFEPPAKIEADVDTNLPFFYEGFDQWSMTGNDVSPIRLDGGLVVIGSRFLIMLEPADYVELTLVSIKPIHLEHGNQTLSVDIGHSMLVWPTSPDSLGRLCFTLISSDGRPLPVDGTDHGLRLQQARNLIRLENP